MHRGLQGCRASRLLVQGHRIAHEAFGRGGACAARLGRYCAPGRRQRRQPWLLLPLLLQWLMRLLLLLRLLLQLRRRLRL